MNCTDYSLRSYGPIVVLRLFLRLECDSDVMPKWEGLCPIFNLIFNPGNSLAQNVVGYATKRRCLFELDLDRHVSSSVYEY